MWPMPDPQLPKATGNSAYYQSVSKGFAKRGPSPLTDGETETQRETACQWLM